MEKPKMMNNFADLIVPEPINSYNVMSFNGTNGMIFGLVFFLIICLVLTIIIELIWALIFGVKGRNIGIVVLAQIITNPLVFLISNYALYTSEAVSHYSSLGTYYVALAILEVCAFIAEGFIYKTFFIKGLNRKERNPFLLSLILNFFSFIAGFIFMI